MSEHHLFPFTPRQLIERAVEKANASHVDLVLLGGDYVGSDVDSIRELAPILGRLNARYGRPPRRAITIVCLVLT